MDSIEDLKSVLGSSAETGPKQKPGEELVVKQSTEDTKSKRASTSKDDQLIDSVEVRRNCRTLPITRLTRTSPTVDQLDLPQRHPVVKPPQRLLPAFRGHGSAAAELHPGHRSSRPVRGVPEVARTHPVEGQPDQGELHAPDVLARGSEAAGVDVQLVRHKVRCYPD